MNRTYIIDGYNVLRASPDMDRTTAAFGIDRARTDLVNAIARFAMVNRCDCTIVFDGVLDRVPSAPRVKVISSRGRSADDVIREIVRTPAGRRSTIVSSDQEIVHTARVNSARVLGSREFLDNLSFDLGDDSASATASDARPHRIAELRERSEKPPTPESDDIEEWKRLFGV
jgi:predicted RNA-binding protein with PIN domain